MCMRTNCSKCGKPTWSGCGAHIEQALAGVPPEQRCQCDKEKDKSPKLFGLFGRGR